MNKSTNILLGIVLVLVIFNLIFTAILLNRLPVDSDTVNPVDPAIARSWGDKVAKLYNRQDHEALYALFNQQARIKISRQQMELQLQKLHEMFGDIEDHAYANSVKLGNKGSETYYQLSFDVRVSENNNPATMKLSLVLENELVSLYGLRINASHSLE